MADKKISQLTGATTPLAGTEVLPVVQGGSTVKVSVANLTAGRATSVGSLAVNTAAPLALVSIGDGTFTDASVPVQVNSASGGENYFGFNKGGGYGMLMGYINNISGVTSFVLRNIANDPITVRVNDTNHTIFNTGGNLTVSNGNLVIGTAGKGIDFSADPSAAGMTSELLDDYEEGTWTVTRNGFTETLNGGSITSTGTYTKIGRQVFVTAIITPAGGATTLATSGGVSALSGLPYVPAVKSTGSWVDTGSIAAQGGLFVNTDGFMYLTTGWGTSAAAFVFSASYIV